MSLFKSLMDTAKGLKDINDATARNAVAIELQEKILAAQEVQSALIERVRNLEAQTANLEAWEAEKARYELNEVAPKKYAYAAKE